MSSTQTAIRARMNAGDWSMLVLLGVLWGGSFFFARVAVAELPPLLLVMLRVTIAAAALQIYLAAFGPSFGLAFRQAPALLLLGVMNNVLPFSLIFLGQTVLGAGVASVLNATTPFWTLVLANALLPDERLTANKIGGIVLGITGTAIMIGPGLAEGLGGPIWAKFALIGASLCYGLSLMLARRLRALPPTIIATGQLTASAVITLPIVLALYGPLPLSGVSGEVWSAVAALALFSTALAYLLYFRLVATAGATNASLVTFIVPVSAMVLGVGVLGERLSISEIAGMAVIAVGLVTIDGRLIAKVGRATDK